MDQTFLKLVPQRHDQDCLICCLAMLLGTSYEATLLAVSKVKPDSGTHGLYWTDARKAARKLGYKVRTVRTKRTYPSLIGVLDCVPTRVDQLHHAVMILRGVVVDPHNQSVWDDWEVYLEMEGYHAGSVLIRAS